MMHVLVPVADGSEELEAITMIDLLRRAGAKVFVASAMDNQITVTASRGVQLNADCLMNQLPEWKWDLIALPGGMPGAENLAKNPILMQLVQQQLQENRWLGAICASPAVILGRNHLIKSATATCFPSFQHELATQVKEVKHDKVIVDRKLITSQGPGTAIAFTLKLIECLYSHNKASEIAAQLVFEY